MPKKPIDITDSVMSKIQSGQVRMKPRIYFLAGTIGLFVGLTGLAFISAFMVSLISFSLRTHGPMGEIRYQQLLSTFPWWAPLVSFASLFFAVYLLKQFDFSYKKNFLLIAAMFIISVVLAGLAISTLGLDRFWSRQGPMRGLYLQIEGGFSQSPGRIRRLNFHNYQPRQSFSLQIPT